MAGSANGQGLYYSTNGQTWTQSSMAYDGFDSIAYGNGLYYSSDGQTWTQSNITDVDFKTIAYGNGLWVAAGNSGGLYYIE